MKVLRLFALLSMFRLSILAAAVTAGYYFMYYDNGEKIDEQIKSVETLLGQEKAKRVEIEKKMKKEEEMRGNVMQLAANLELVKRNIPNEFNQIEILTIVNRVSESSHVKISQLKPASPKPGDKKLVTGAELIEEVNFDIEMSGSFSSIVSFVDALSKEQKIIKIRNFALEKVPGELTQDTVIKFAGEIVGFKQSQGAKAPATPAPGAPGAPAAPNGEPPK